MMQTTTDGTQDTYTPRRLDDVLARALECTLAGLGAGVVVGVVCAVADVGWWLTATAAAATWGAITGALSVWTFTRDARQWQAMVWEIDELDEQCEALQDALDTVTNRNEYLMAENARLTMLTNTKTNYVPAAAASDPVRQDAQTLIDVWASSGFVAPTQRQMLDRGWTQAQYAAARALLVSRGVIDGSSNRGAWLAQTMQAAQAAIE
jgi:hypothetical protein